MSPALETTNLARLPAPGSATVKIEVAQFKVMVTLGLKLLQLALNVLLDVEKVPQAPVHLQEIRTNDVYTFFNRVAHLVGVRVNENPNRTHGSL